MRSTRVKLTESQLTRVIHNIVNESGIIKVPTDAGSPNQALDNKKVPNTGRYNFGSLHDDDDYEKTITTNVESLPGKDWKGPNDTSIPGDKNDKKSNLKMSDNFGFNGVKIKRGRKKDQSVKIGKHFSKDMKKGSPHKKTKKQPPSLHPKRHSNSTPITNVVHRDGVTRGGVVYDSSFKPGPGGDPFTKKTS